MKKQIKIISCKSHHYWYHNMIGEIITIIDYKDEDENYWIFHTNEDEIEILFIDKDDAIIFDRKKKINKILNNIKN